MKIKINSYKLLFRLLDLLSNNKWLHKLVINPKIYLGASIISLSLISNSCSSDKTESKETEEKKDSITKKSATDSLVENMEIKKDSSIRLINNKHKVLKRPTIDTNIEIVSCYDISVEEPLEIPVEDDELKKINTKPINTPITILDVIKTPPPVVHTSCYAISDPIYITYPLPEFGAGDSLFQEYLDSNIIRLKGPENISGTMSLEFVITQSGNIKNIIIQKSLHPDLDKEAIRVIKNMPNRFWYLNTSQYENTKYSLPIKFIAK